MALAGRGGTLGGDPGGELAIALCYSLLPQNMMKLKCRGFLGGFQSLLYRSTEAVAHSTAIICSQIWGR